MTRWEHAPELYDLADQLGVGSAAPVSSILAYCQGRVDAWVAEAGGVRSISDLESLVASKLQMDFEEVKSDEDWDRIKAIYARGKKEYVFGGIRTKFEDDHNLTYGALVQLRNAGPLDPIKFIAVIDCRGSKGARRFFTRWHEIAHRLTTHADMPETVFRSEQDPIERMMDEIAGQIGFYEPIFIPAYQQASQGRQHLDFGMVQVIIDSSFPTASFQSTLFACARRLPTPVVYVEAALGHKKEVKRKLATLSMFDDDVPPGELRAIKVIPNKVAFEEGFTIPTNMRVPTGSVIHQLFNAEPLSNSNSQECLSYWESQGRSLERRAVVVEARKVPDRVIAIVQPMTPMAKSQKIEAESFLLNRADHVKARVVS